MKIKCQPMGDYQTNCYILTTTNSEGKEIDIIIDPGVNATPWISENVTNPIAILNTHGHFDHVWSNAEVQKLFNIPLYTPKDDAFLLTSSNWMPDLPPSTPDFLVEGEVTTLNLEGVEVIFRHYPGHCPGCSTIEIGDTMFSGDFIFERSIGRVDFPYSSAEDMKKSLKKFQELDYDKTIYPGHGGTTTIKAEQQNANYWMKAI